MKNIGVFLSENFQFLEVKFSIYLNRRVFVMSTKTLWTDLFPIARCLVSFMITMFYRNFCI